MSRPVWIEPRLWPRLKAALAAQPDHTADALADLEAVTACWSDDRRRRLVERVTGHALAGVPFPAALMVALTETLDD
jgi:hypothetical protein